jgi:hypothetical protein
LEELEMKTPLKMGTRTIYATSIYDSEGRFVAQAKGADAERIVACVNACAGLNPEAIPGLVQVVAEVVRDEVFYDDALKDKLWAALAAVRKEPA